ncbi:hypothetical protein [Pseudomonas sp. A2]|uniref:hypothetical protein n=1 Tax=Pseudomonas sp. A2 TaxID=107445 RepID=UPI0020001EDA|nr:hypothetical protein [Pseudomonas sp. A2]UPK86860.1 hypothetical protein E5221_18575 [Pseudomonas sp. A2]
MQAPTDSLYKFIAISGLIGFIFIYFDSHRRYDELYAKVEDDQIKIAELSATVKSYTNQKEYLERTLKSLDESQATRRERLLKEYDAHMSKVQGFEVALGVITATVKARSERSKRLDELLTRYKLFSGLFLGLFVFGVQMWYLRLQRFIDAKEKVIPTSEAKESRLKDRLPKRGM